MPIGSLPPGQSPRVIEHMGEIAIWAGSADDPMGLVFSAEAGFDVGIECLTLASSLAGRIVKPLSMELSVEDNVELDDDVAGRMLFKIEGAPFEVLLTATQVCEFAATFAAMAKRFEPKLK